MDFFTSIFRKKKLANLPTLLELPYLQRKWSVQYQYYARAERVVIHTLNNELIFEGKVTHRPSCQQAIKEWLTLLARRNLTPLMQEISQTTGLTYKKLFFRQQKTLWGSCSRAGDISLNINLLFLSPECVRYILIHELCHTIHFNHSAQFWSLVAQFEPNYLGIKRQIKHAEKMIFAG